MICAGRGPSFSVTQLGEMLGLGALVLLGRFIVGVIRTDANTIDLTEMRAVSERDKMSQGKDAEGGRDP